MKKLIILCGIPGAGKSTFIKNHQKFFETNIKVVSRDEIRFSLVKENEEYFSKEKEVWTKYVNDIKESLEKNETTIADATHLNPTSRLKLINALGSNLKEIEVIPVVLKVGYELAAVQNENRIGTRSYVPPAVIRNMSKNFVMPSFEEYDYKAIYIYEPNKKALIRERS